MAISKIKTGSITDSAVNTNKLAPGSVGSTDISATVITGQTELSEIAADTDFTIIYDTSAGALKKILRSNLKQSGPTISSISPTNTNDSVVTQTFTITGTGFTAGSNARFIDANGKITEFDTVTRNSTTQITATIATSSLSGNNDPYDIQVTNGEGLSTLLASQVNFNASPTFVTASGSLGSDRISMAGVEVNATDPESAAPVTFELQSGSLPPGISITNTGANGGTATFTGTFSSLAASDTVYNFTLRAVDSSSATSSRAFSFTAQGPQYLSFTSSGTFTVPVGLTSVDVLVVGGGGRGSQAGGGAGGLIFVPGFPITPGTPIPVTVGLGGGPAQCQPNLTATGRTGTNHHGGASIFSTLKALGGGGSWGSCTGPGGGPGLDPTGSVVSAQGGSGGGLGYCGPGIVIPTARKGKGLQPTESGQSGAYGFGNPGGRGFYNGNPFYGIVGGGGGGAGAPGTDSNPIGDPAPGGAAGQGGIGKAYTIADGATPVYYAGGGGGGGSRRPGGPLGYNPWTGGTGGQGGGGQGSGAGGPSNGGGPTTFGGANKGGGGGGLSHCSSACYSDGSGGGGKGIVIVKY